MSIQRQYAQPTVASIVHVDLSGTGSIGNPGTASVDLRFGSVFSVDCSNLQSPTAYLSLDTATTAGSMPGKVATFIFNTDAVSGTNIQNLVIRFSENFNSNSTLTYTTQVTTLNPSPVITLVSDGQQWSVQSSQYVTSSAAPVSGNGVAVNTRHLTSADVIPGSPNLINLTFNASTYSVFILDCSGVYINSTSPNTIYFNISFNSYPTIGSSITLIFTNTTKSGGNGSTYIDNFDSNTFTGIIYVNESYNSGGIVSFIYDGTQFHLSSTQDAGWD